MKYQDGAEWLSDGEESKNEIHGFVFFYPEGEDFAQICKVIEFEIDNQETRKELLAFEKLLTQILYVQNEQTRIILSSH